MLEWLVDLPLPKILKMVMPMRFPMKSKKKFLDFL